MDTEHKLLIPSEAKSKNDTLLDVVSYFAGYMGLDLVGIGLLRGSLKILAV